MNSVTAELAHTRKHRICAVETREDQSLSYIKLNIISIDAEHKQVS